MQNFDHLRRHRHFRHHDHDHDDRHHTHSIIPSFQHPPTPPSRIPPSRIQQERWSTEVATSYPRGRRCRRVTSGGGGGGSGGGGRRRCWRWRWGGGVELGKRGEMGSGGWWAIKHEAMPFCDCHCNLRSMASRAPSPVRNPNGVQRQEGTQPPKTHNRKPPNERERTS